MPTATPPLAGRRATAKSPRIDTRPRCSRQDREEKNTCATVGCLPACVGLGSSSPAVPSSPACSTSSPTGFRPVRGSPRDTEQRNGADTPDGTSSVRSRSSQSLSAPSTVSIAPPLTCATLPFSTTRSLTVPHLPVPRLEHPRWTWSGLNLHPGAWSVFPSRSWQEQLLSQAAAAAASAALARVNLDIGNAVTTLRSPNLPIHGPAFNALAAASVPQLPHRLLPNVPAPVAVAVAVALRWAPTPCPQGCVVPWGPPHAAAHTSMATHCHTCGSCLSTTTVPATTQSMVHRRLALPSGRSLSRHLPNSANSCPVTSFRPTGRSSVTTYCSMPSMMMDMRGGVPMQRISRMSVPICARDSGGASIEQPVPSQCITPASRRTSKVQQGGSSVPKAASKPAVPVSIERRPSPRWERQSSAQSAETNVVQTESAGAPAAAAAARAG